VSDWRNICKDRDERPEVQEYKHWKELPPIPISFPDNAALTGAWRTLRPVLDQEKCTKCGNCWLFCPEGTISTDEDGNYVIDLEYCKGCGVCAKECNVDAMKMIPEGEAQREDSK
jgi:pyruvate ferredoxin oxidoreductase delta subunit